MGKSDSPEGDRPDGPVSPPPQPVGCWATLVITVVGGLIVVALAPTVGRLAGTAPAVEGEPSFWEITATVIGKIAASIVEHNVEAMFLYGVVVLGVAINVVASRDHGWRERLADANERIADLSPTERHAKHIDETWRELNDPTTAVTRDSLTYAGLLHSLRKRLRKGLPASEVPSSALHAWRDAKVVEYDPYTYGAPVLITKYGEAVCDRHAHFLSGGE